MRLNVDVFAIEQLAGAFDGQVFNLVDHLATAVIALARIALGVFVGEHRPLGLEHFVAHIIF